MDTARCSKCKEDKDIENFSTNRRYSKILFNWCDECVLHRQYEYVHQQQLEAEMKA